MAVYWELTFEVNTLWNSKSGYVKYDYSSHDCYLSGYFGVNCGICSGSRYSHRIFNPRLSRDVIYLDYRTDGNIAEI
jgi:hypothetical protein